MCPCQAGDEFVVLSGSRAHEGMMGAYMKTELVQSGRPVYKKASCGADGLYIFYPFACGTRRRCARQGYYRMKGASQFRQRV